MWDFLQEREGIVVNLLWDWLHQVIICAAENLSYASTNSRCTGCIEQYLGRFVDLRDAKLRIQQNDSFVDAIKLCPEQVIVGQNTLQILNIEDDRANQIADVPEQPLLSISPCSQPLHLEHRLIVVVDHDNGQRCPILLVQDRDRDSIFDRLHL